MTTLVYIDKNPGLRHTAPRHLVEMSSRADVIISATGVIGLIKPEMIKEGAILIDVGISRKITPGGKVRLMGDIDPKCKGNVIVTFFFENFLNLTIFI